MFGPVGVGLPLVTRLGLGLHPPRPRAPISSSIVCCRADLVVLSLICFLAPSFFFLFLLHLESIESFSISHLGHINPCSSLRFFLELPVSAVEPRPIPIAQGPLVHQPLLGRISRAVWPPLHPYVPAPPSASAPNIVLSSLDFFWPGARQPILLAPTPKSCRAPPPLHRTPPLPALRFLNLSTARSICVPFSITHTLVLFPDPTRRVELSVSHLAPDVTFFIGHS